MVAPATGLLKSIVDEIATQLDTIDGLRVYKYPVEAVQEFPAAIVRDDQTSTQSSLAEYRSTTPEVVYHLEVLVLVDQADDKEAYEELEKYISADSASSVKAIVDGASVTGVQSMECVKAGSRRRLVFGGRSLWSCCFSLRNIVT